MKQFLIPFISVALLATACHKTADTPAESAPATLPAAKEDSLTNSPAEAVDALSAATQVANAPFFNGTIMIPPQQHTTVTLSMGGAVHTTSLLPGSYIRKGDIIATLENPDFIQLQQSYLEAAAQTEYLGQEYQRQQTLASQEAASLKRLQQSKAEYLSTKSKQEASAALLAILGIDARELSEKGIRPYLEIKAPRDGYITSMNINTGKYIQAGEAVCDIIDKHDAMIQLTAYEKDLDELNPGDKLTFRVNGIDGKEFEATLISIDQRVDETNRSINVYARILNPSPVFRPGMYVSAQKSQKKQ